MAFENCRFPMLRRLVYAALASLATTGAFAEEKLVFGNPDYFCRNGAFPGGGQYSGARPVFKMSRITGPAGTKVHFSMDYGGPSTDTNCTKQQGRICLSSDYLVPGDQVILSKTLNGLGCSWYQPKHGPETVGWLPLSRLKIQESAVKPTLSQWLGTWKSGDDTFVVTRNSGSDALHIAGRAYWPGRDAADYRTGQVNGNARPDGNVLRLDEGAATSQGVQCHVELSRVGKFLVANDNHLCGGFNVNFDGVYLLQRR